MASLRPFNTSTNDSKSLKLRNPQLSSRDSERLDTDNYKMEARLSELKLSMRRQKQERENMHSDGSIWSSGRPGAVTTHGTDLLKKEPSKPVNSRGKARKIKVLKDSPLDIPKRAPVASFSDTSPPKLKGPACGQCEQKAVALTCMECGENYCTTCFAKFHLKGALKNHRSVPFQSNTSSSSSSSLDLSNGTMPSPQNSTDGLPPRPSSASRRTTTSTDTTSNQVKTIPVKLKDPGEMTGGAFLQGTFSEEESALSFAQALAEWRAGKENSSMENSRPQEVKKVESTSSGTSTEVEPRPIEITFKEDTSITYADKLLLKKHRRTELSPLPSPRLSSDENVEKYSPRQRNQTMTNGHMEALSDDESELQQEHQRYASVFIKSKTPEQPRLESALSIVEVTEAPSSEVMEVESVYSVEELDDPRAQTVGRSARGDGGAYTLSNEASPDASLAPQSSEPTPKMQSNQPKYPTLSSAKVSSQKQQHRPESTTKPQRSVSTPISRSTPDANKLHKNKQQRSTLQQLDATERPASGQAKSKHALQSSPVKPKSQSARVTAQRQPSTRSREFSHVPESRTPASGEDASGRLSGLTSIPSGELISVSHLTQQPQHRYKVELGDFFLAGLGGEEGGTKTEDVENRGSITPVNQMPECSYKGALSAWRPDSSLASPAVRDSVKPFSPSPPPKSSRNSHRSATKPRPVKPPDTQELRDVRYRGQSAKVKGGRSSGRPRPDTDTISWMLSEQLAKKWKGLNSNSGNWGDEIPATERAGSKQSAEPDRSSSCIEVDGDDMTIYDSAGKDDTETADTETLEKLTWELASQSGRISADGCLTSMSLPDPGADDDIYRENSFSQDAELGILEDDGMGSGLSTPFDFLTGESLSPEESDRDDMDDLELQRYTVEVQALN